MLTDSPTESVTRNGRRKPTTTDSIHTVQLSRCRPAWGDHQKHTVAVRVAVRPRPSHFTDVRSADLTCAADLCGPTRTRLGQAFIREQDPHAARNWVPPVRCPRGRTNCSDHQRTGQVRSLISSLIHVRVPRSTTGCRWVPSRAGDQRGQPWTVILNPEKRKVGSPILSLTTSSEA